MDFKDLVVNSQLSTVDILQAISGGVLDEEKLPGLLRSRMNKLALDFNEQVPDLAMQDIFRSHIATVVAEIALEGKPGAALQSAREFASICCTKEVAVNEARKIQDKVLSILDGVPIRKVVYERG